MRSYIQYCKHLPLWNAICDSMHILKLFTLKEPFEINRIVPEEDVCALNLDKLYRSFKKRGNQCNKWVNIIA